MRHLKISHQKSKKLKKFVGNGYGDVDGKAVNQYLHQFFKLSTGSIEIL